MIAVASNGTVDISTVGDYVLDYTYIDSSGNTGSTQRQVKVVAPDTTPPVISLVGNATVSGEVGIGYVDDGATWTDNVDGSGVIAAFTSGSVDVNTLGSYVVEYEYTDGAGNIGTSVSRIIDIVDTTAPNVVVSGEVIMSIPQNTPYFES